MHGSHKFFTQTSIYDISIDGMPNKYKLKFIVKVIVNRIGDEINSKVFYMYFCVQMLIFLGIGVSAV